MASNIFTIDRVSFSYGDAPLFSDFSLTLPEGKVTTLIGANGSGKSTLFDLMTKNLKPRSGSIFLRGGDVAALRLRDFAKLVAIVHQRNIAPADLSVEKLVSYGRFPYRTFGHAGNGEEDEAMVNWALSVCELDGCRHQSVSSLSGGQAQRVWIALALAQGSKVLLLDEPTTYLDVRYQLDILRLVRRLNEEFAMTVIMVLHDINQALHYSDEVVALEGGRLIAQGAPTDIVSEELLAEVYGIPLRVVEVDGKPFVLEV
ncbi:ABC transporter ATP-binding protein [Adlercreutzia sp. R25]|uniref:ABC transporter ATP-binding protein n=1 Tax=Adlercreutzia shanghongiae TaxID=3111773 RepID=A0ABU6J072_9ACTN|nr:MULTISPECIES: ABC transporter ATP-binding protein [unclassified Adlercreutzia]MEC4273269.1 ABC transporter ATP-binding protein [Adlercreutzia sp. R25]MEC4295502.1 ABC transporter ATP-binding protein [Adlercreutzia sp. R22]